MGRWSMEIVIELGDFDDNWTVLSLAVARLARGDQGGMEMLLRLRSHIIQTGEGKSRVYTQIKLVFGCHASNK